MFGIRNGGRWRYSLATPTTITKQGGTEMKVGLHDAEKEHLRRKTFPNFALMKLSAYHKSLGDEVEWWNPETEFDRVYSSKVFDFTPTNPLLPPHVIRGGTGYEDIPINQTLTKEIDDCFPDYSIYPTCDFSIGYLTRGCPRKCPWCVVPKKEGEIKPYKTWREVVRDDTMKLTLLDNNILACDYGISQLEELSHTKYKLDLNQGMDARLVTEEVAQILSKLKWQRFMRFSCDRKEQIPSIINTIELLGKFGMKPWRIFLYILVTKDVGDAAYRVETLSKLGNLSLYAQAERNTRDGIIPNKEQKEFCGRYVYGKSYRKETWVQYKERNNFNFSENN